MSSISKSQLRNAYLVAKNCIDYYDAMDERNNQSWLKRLFTPAPRNPVPGMSKYDATTFFENAARTYLGNKQYIMTATDGDPSGIEVRPDVSMDEKTGKVTMALNVEEPSYRFRLEAPNENGIIDPYRELISLEKTDRRAGSDLRHYVSVCDDFLKDVASIKKSASSRKAFSPREAAKVVADIKSNTVESPIPVVPPEPPILDRETFLSATTRMKELSYQGRRDNGNTPELRGQWKALMDRRTEYINSPASIADLTREARGSFASDEELKAAQDTLYAKCKEYDIFQFPKLMFCNGFTPEETYQTMIRNNNGEESRPLSEIKGYYRHFERSIRDDMYNIYKCPIETPLKQMADKMIYNIASHKFISDTEKYIKDKFSSPTIPRAEETTKKLILPAITDAIVKGEIPGPPKGLHSEDTKEIIREVIEKTGYPHKDLSDSFIGNNIIDTLKKHYKSLPLTADDVISQKSEEIFQTAEYLLKKNNDWKFGELLSFIGYEGRAASRNEAVFSCINNVDPEAFRKEFKWYMDDAIAYYKANGFPPKEKLPEAGNTTAVNTERIISSPELVKTDEGYNFLVGGTAEEPKYLLDFGCPAAEPFQDGLAKITLPQGLQVQINEKGELKGMMLGQFAEEKAETMEEEKNFGLKH